MKGPTVIVKHPRGHFINVYPITCPESGNIYYPLRPAYSCTIAKVQGQTIPEVTIWIDSVSAPPGTLYVALSQVRRLENLVFLQRLTLRQLVPVDESLTT